MPRPKGSKNKNKTVKATVDFAAQIAEKQSAKEAAAAEIASITANIDALKADLKTKKAELKSAAEAEGEVIVDADFQDVPEEAAPAEEAAPVEEAASAEETVPAEETKPEA